MSAKNAKLRFRTANVWDDAFRREKIFVDDENKFTCIVQLFKILLNGRVISVAMVREKSF